MDVELNLKRLDEVFGLDDDTRAVRDRMMNSLSRCSTAADLWELYRSTAIPAGAPLVQLHETRVAIYWTIAALGQVLGTQPDALNRLLVEVSEFGLSQVQRRMG